MIKIKLPVPPSVNQCYGTNIKKRRNKETGEFEEKFNRFVSREYEQWKRDALIEFRQKWNGISIAGDEWIKMEMFLCVPIWNKNGYKKKIDCMNYEKPTNDFLGWCRKNQYTLEKDFVVISGFEDHKIIDFRISKVHTEKEESCIWIFFDEVDESESKNRLREFMC